MSDSAVRKNSNNAHMIVQRINDLQNLCAENRLPCLVEGTKKDVVMLDDNDNDTGTSNENDTSANHQQQVMMTGVVINGFHPQLSTWHKNLTKIENRTASSRNLGREIKQTVNSLRTEESKSVRNSNSFDQPRFSCDTTVSDIYSDVFENSNIAQIISTPGGRFGAWNKEFLRVCSFAPSGPYASLTVFDLVQPSALPRLHQIFLTALHDENISPLVEEDCENSHELKYLVLTVPCIDFNKSGSSYFMTLSLMGDKDPKKRCFHCIISSKPTSIVGEIVYITQDELMKIL